MKTNEIVVQDSPNEITEAIVELDDAELLLVGGGIGDTVL